MNELALFAGAGGGILGGRLIGWRTVCAVELDAYARRVLIARQDDGSLKPFPIWDDVRTFDGRPWRGIIDVVSGGFPCQDISVAGKGAGIDGERSGLWAHMARIIGEVRPRFALVENSPALVGRGLSRVLGDLASLGYDAEWGVLSAAAVGAPHRRERLWIACSDTDRSVRGGPAPVWGHWHDIERFRDAMADADRVGQLQPGGMLGPEWGRIGDGGCAPLVDSDGAQREGDECAFGVEPQHADIGGAGWWAAEPDVGRVAHGVAARVDRLRCIGNGQVPQCAAEAFRQLAARLRGGPALALQTTNSGSGST